MRDEYWNVYICRFNDAGECTSFIEYWIQSRDMRKKRSRRSLPSAWPKPKAAGAAA